MIARHGAYTGDNVYNTSGVGQTDWLSVAPGGKAVYLTRFYNDGDAADGFTITGRGGNTSWGVSYFDHRTGADITTSVTGTGWTTPSLPPRAYCWVRVEVTAAARLSAGRVASLLITATSVGDGDKRDAVKAITTCALTRRPDALILSSGTYIGDDIYNTSGAGQTCSSTAPAGSPATYLVRACNDGNEQDSFLITGRPGDQSWGVRYFDHATGIERTGDVTGAGFTAGPLRPGAFTWLRVEVTPLDSARGDSTLSRLVTVTSLGDTSKTDAVRTLTTCAPTYQPDGTIRNSVAYIGDGVYNTNGDGQRYAQTVARGATVAFAARVFNDGNVPQRLIITGTAGNPNWAVQYIDYATGAEITQAVRGTGYRTPVLAPGASRRIRVLVTPGASVMTGEARAVLLTATSALDGTRKDAVEAIATRR